MSTTNALALTLPTKAPPFSEDRPLDPARFAIFYTAPLTTSSVQRLESLVNSSSASSDNSQLAPTPDFRNRSLRDVYDHFIILREENETIEPSYFIVADRLDFEVEGVLGVYLDRAQDGDGVIGVARCAVELADTWGVQFCIGWRYWEEMKEEEADEWGPGDVPAVEWKARRRVEREKAAASQGWEPWRAAMDKKLVFGWYSLVQAGRDALFVYVSDDLADCCLTAVPINTMLERSWLEMQPAQCGFVMLGNFQPHPNPWPAICREHPRQCAARPRLHRTIVLVAEKEDANQSDGIAIVRLLWDGDTRSIDEQTPQPECEVLTRLSAGEAIREADRLSRQLGLS